MEEKEEAATSLASNFRKMLKKFPGCIRRCAPSYNATILRYPTDTQTLLLPWSRPASSGVPGTGRDSYIRLGPEKKI